MNLNRDVFDVVVIGAGQAGLASGWQLQQQGLDFLILDEQNQPGGNWRHYYDSLQLFSPAAYSSLPGLAFPGKPGHYPVRDEVVHYLETYAELFQLPILQGIRVERVDQTISGFQLTTAHGQQFQAKAVIVASGAFSRPYIPEITGLDGFGGKLLHSADYRNPQGFRGERVVVVGAANSAVQIACDLANTASVTLATREAIRFAPQRLLGIDFHAWLKWTGLEKTRWLNDQSTPVLDNGIYKAALRANRFSQKPMFTRVTPTGVEWRNGNQESVDSLVFATGFRPNLPFLKGLPVVNEQGKVLQRDGSALRVPGLFFVGLPKQRNFASATLRGAGPDAAHILPPLQAYLRGLQHASTPMTPDRATRA
ncbi:flavin-containing monooxygenase [Halopseudomonas salegens]|uniref:Putative flavoprotein involved in K+ transport n=1 Tax=Halopseudomonas salegens TaxID=1434072 RepID=A0A1H2HEQ1_9GAMM|nr:NAD(P)-binding domain-containing protein [Halopseudomonas salegens]SDU30350.1 putative flavoprotein involved in K+ transport [Halopseudomonas salegens]